MSFSAMRIYIFKSKASAALYAFAGDVEGTTLPAQFAPWRPDGTIEAGGSPPHNFSRFKIESAIKLHGFQLWRMKQPPELKRPPSTGSE
jgi:hypothetical protein